MCACTTDDDLVMSTVAVVSSCLLKGTTCVVLHAGAFVADGQALLFIGPEFAGKSSLALAAWRSGLPLVGEVRQRLACHGTVARWHNRAVRQGTRPMASLRGLTPLAIFLLLGLAVFALDGWRDGDAGERTIVVTEAQLASIREQWAAQWDRPPTDEELAGLVEDAVKEETLYREALRLGLDRGDTIVRRRLAQKMTFMLEDGAGVAPPTEDELEAFHATRGERYREPRRTTFVHVFLSDDRRADPAGDARALLDELARSDGNDWRQRGDPFMLLREYADRTDQEIAELFGDHFAAALPDLTPDVWHGPIRSAYGTHLVRVVARSESRTPSFNEVRDRVVEDLVAERRREQNEAAFDALRARYEVLMPEATANGSP